MEVRLGRDVGDTLRALGERVESEDFDFVVQAIDIHREVGGDLAEVLTNVAGTIRDRNRVRLQIKTLTAEGRISAGILLALPIVMFFLVQLINPTYLQELTGSSVGRVMLGIGIALMVIGGVWMRRLIRLVF
jgi:tight adherence protein B